MKKSVGNYLELNPMNCKKDAKKKNLLAMDSSQRLEKKSNVDESIVYTFLKIEVDLNTLHHKEEKEMTNLFDVNIQVKNIEFDALFDSNSQANIIA